MTLFSVDCFNLASPRLYIRHLLGIRSNNLYLYTLIFIFILYISFLFRFSIKILVSDTRCSIAEMLSGKSRLSFATAVLTIKAEGRTHVHLNIESRAISGSKFSSGCRLTVPPRYPITLSSGSQLILLPARSPRGCPRGCLKTPSKYACLFDRPTQLSLPSRRDSNPHFLC